MLNQKKIAIVGATGTVGGVLSKLLAREQFPAHQLHFLASQKSKGQQVSYLDQTLAIQALDEFDFSKVDIAFFAAGNEVAKIYAPKAAQKGCWVIDKSSYFRQDPNVPLIIPEVNWQDIETYASHIIATPNCSTTQLVLALKPLHDLAEVERVEIATYQAVSGAGQLGIEALSLQMKKYMSGEGGGDARTASGDQFIPIAFNVVPLIDEVLPSGFTKEEVKMQEETTKILHADIRVNATAVRVPVWHGHSEAVHIKTKKPLTLEAAAQALQAFPGIKYCAHTIPTALTHAEGNDWVWVARLRRHPQDGPEYLNFWLISDNLHKGAAWNAIQIAKGLS